MTTLIMKYGSTSVDTAEGLSQVADIMMQHAKWDRLVSVSRNTLRGAASGSIPYAERLVAAGYIQ